MAVSVPRKVRKVNPNSLANLRKNGHDGFVVHRPKGAKNKITREIRQAILDAVENVGDRISIATKDPRGEMGIVAYLEQIAVQHPVAMCGLLARILPIQQESPQTVDVTYHTFEEITNKLRELGLPAERIYPLLEAKAIDDAEVTDAPHD
jgi:hypothetical protein